MPKKGFDEELDEMFPDEGGAVGLSAILKEEKPKKVEKTVKPEEELYEKIKNLQKAIPIAIDKGNSNVVWKELEEILKTYKKLFL